MEEDRSVVISEQEAEQYDRQIRLWGLDAQKRLRTAKVLLIGFGGLGAEVAKNIILSGINSITLLDHRVVSDRDQTCQFLVSQDDVGTNRAEAAVERAQQLNPMVTVKADTDQISHKEADFFKLFDIICATCCQQEEMIRINEICHTNNIMFLSGDVFGHYGYMFVDLNRHQYVEEVQKQIKNTEQNEESSPLKKQKIEQTETVTVKKWETFTRFKDALSKNWQTEDSSKKLKATPKTFFIVLVLLKFRAKHDRDPSLEDCDELIRLKHEVLADRDIDTDIIDNSFSSFSHGELSPSCAIVGGILSQEIIKAISKKDKPINNFFTFNPFKEYGMVDCIC